MQKDYNEVAKAVLHQFIYGNYNAQDFKEILEPKMFGAYARLYEVFTLYEKERLVKDGMLTTEAMTLCSKESLNAVMTEVMTSPYYSFYVYNDIGFLIQNFYKSKNPDDVFAMVDAIRQRKEKLAKMHSDIEAKKYQIGSLYDKIVTDAVALSDKKWILGYSTGIKTLDSFTDGLQKGTLMRLTAYSNIGKSKLAYHVCNALLRQGLSVLFFSLEVTKERVAHNLMMSWYNKPYAYISRGQWIGDSTFECWDFFSRKLEIVDDIYTLDGIVNFTRARKPDVVFIDFVQNIQTWHKEEYQAMTQVAVTLQQLAIKERIAIFDLSQVAQEQAGNYRIGGKIPSKGSGALVASADVNLVMERDYDTDHNLLYVAKNKFWMNGKCIELAMNFATNQVEDLGEHIILSKQIKKL